MASSPELEQLTLHDPQDLRAVAGMSSLARLRIVGGRCSVRELAALSSLRELVLDDPQTLDGLDLVKQLAVLTVYCFPQVRSLAPIGSLHGLESLLLSTPPGYDASRKCHEVDSLKPLGNLRRLRKLIMRGVLPGDRTLAPLHSLTQLETLEVTHVYCFSLEDHALLARALPNTRGHCLMPFFEASWTGNCRKCGARRVALTAPPPRSPRLACPNCNAERLRRHEAEWNAIARRN
jgi:hypothetical protein